MERTELWKQRIEGCKESGLSQLAYCKNNSISNSSFNYWKKKLHSPKQDYVELNLTKLPVKIKSFNTNLFTIECPFGYKIQVPESFNSNSLKRLLLDLKEIFI